MTRAAHRTPRRHIPRKLDGQNRRRRGDGWQNTKSGLGTQDRDRHWHTRFEGGVSLSIHQLRNIFRWNAIARRIVAKPPAVAMSRGLELRTEGDLEKLQAEVRRLRLYETVTWARVLGRLFGTSLLIANVEGGQPEQPLEMVQRIVNLRVVPRGRISQILYDSDKASSRHGEPEFYVITSPRGESVTVHHTRCVRFCGLRLDEDGRRLNGGFDAPVIEGVFDALAASGAGAAALATQLHDANQGVFAVKGLRQMIRRGDPGEIEAWIEEVDYSRSVLGSVLIDADGESFEYKARALKDSVEVTGDLRFEVAAAADMPMHELYGKREGGLSSSEIEATRKWYDKVDVEERAGEMGEALRWLFELIAAQSTAEAGVRGYVVTFTWPSLWRPSAKEEAEIRRTDAQSARIHTQLGSVLASEVRASVAEDSFFKLNAEVWEASQSQGSTDLSPLERVQQTRLLFPTGALHLDPRIANPLRALLGMPDWTAADRTEFLANRQASSGGAAPGGTGSVQVDGRADAIVGMRRDAETGTGGKVALMLRLPESLGLQRGPLPQDDSPAHVTMLYIGNVQGREQELLRIVRQEVARHEETCRATLGGLEHLINRVGQIVFYQSVYFDRWSIEDLRDRIVERLRASYLPVADVSPRWWLPHLTLAYEDDAKATFSGVTITGSWHVGEVEVWGLGEVEVLPLAEGDGEDGGGNVSTQEDEGDA